MDRKNLSVRIAHQDIIEDDGTLDYIVIMELTDLDRVQIVYKCRLPDDFLETQKTYKLYGFVHN